MRKYEVSINNKQYSVVVKKYTNQDAELEINGKPYQVTFDEPIAGSPPNAQQVTAPPVQNFQPGTPPPQPQTQPASTEIPKTAPTAPPVSEGGINITAPIPGSVLSILVKVGDNVADGQTVIKMEAMKMENDINAIGGGTVKSINVSVGDAVNQGQILMTIE